MVFALDSSGSIHQKNFDIMKEFLVTLIKDFPVETLGMRVAVETFADSSQSIFHLNR